MSECSPNSNRHPNPTLGSHFPISACRDPAEWWSLGPVSFRNPDNRRAKVRRRVRARRGRVEQCSGVGAAGPWPDRASEICGPQEPSARGEGSGRRRAEAG